MKIFLIGLPGSGKTTIGLALSERLSMDFVDLDQQIELREGRKVTEIFAADGEDYFRRVEAALLREYAASAASFVMSTGGGTPCFLGGIQVINESGLSVFLDEAIEVIVSRLANNRNRPLLRSDNPEDMRTRLERLRESRLNCYEQAAIRVPSPTLARVLGYLIPGHITPAGG